MPRKHSFCGVTPTVRRIIIASTLALLSLICTRTTRRGSMCASTECLRDMTTHLEALITIKPFFILLNWSVEVCLVHLIIKIAKLFVLNALGITSCSQLHTELTSMLPFLSSCFFLFCLLLCFSNQLRYGYYIPFSIRGYTLCLKGEETRGRARVLREFEARHSCSSRKHEQATAPLFSSLDRVFSFLNFLSACPNKQSRLTLRLLN